jgi:hypothetical protein
MLGEFARRRAVGGGDVSFDGDEGDTVGTSDST